MTDQRRTGTDRRWRLRNGATPAECRSRDRYAARHDERARDRAHARRPRTASPGKREGIWLEVAV